MDHIPCMTAWDHRDGKEVDNCTRLRKLLGDSTIQQLPVGREVSQNYLLRVLIL
jgi:hypothetical protein